MSIWRRRAPKGDNGQPYTNFRRRKTQTRTESELSQRDHVNGTEITQRSMLLKRLQKVEIRIDELLMCDAESVKSTQENMKGAEGSGAIIIVYGPNTSEDAVTCPPTTTSTYVCNKQAKWGNSTEVPDVTHYYNGRWIDASSGVNGNIVARKMTSEDVTTVQKMFKVLIDNAETRKTLYQPHLTLLAVLNLLTFLLATILSMLATDGYLSVTQSSIMDATVDTHILPAFWAFSIWILLDVMYALFLLYSLSTFLIGCTGFSSRPIMTSSAFILRKIGHNAWVSNIFRSLWTVLFVQTNISQWYSVFALVGFIVPLIIIEVRTGMWRRSYSNWADVFFYGMTFSLNLGWGSVALTEGIAGALKQGGWDGYPLDEDIWSALVLCVVYLISNFYLIYFKDPGFGIPISWALIGIYVKQDGYVSILAIVLGVVNGVCCVVMGIIIGIRTSYMNFLCCRRVSCEKVTTEIGNINELEKMRNKDITLASGDDIGTLMYSITQNSMSDKK